MSDQGYKTKLVMHGKLEKGGSIFIYELVDFPGIQISDIRENRIAKVDRTIAYGEEEFSKISEAVEAWKSSGGINV